jgi:predicted small secreted protein
MQKTVALLLTLLLVALAGCNTMRGLGKDIEQVGDKIQKKAQ